MALRHGSSRLLLRAVCPRLSLAAPAAETALQALPPGLGRATCGRSIAHWIMPRSDDAAGIGAFRRGSIWSESVEHPRTTGDPAAAELQCRRALSTATPAPIPWTKQSLSWVYSSPVWRAVVGTPLVALNLLGAAIIYAAGPSTFSKTLDRSKTVYPPIMDGLESKLVDGNGIKIHVMATPAQEGKPLMVFVHGFPEFWYSWRYQLKHFSKEYQVAAVDMRGYNLSDKPQGVHSYTIDQVASDIPGVVKALGHSKCVLVGHDWGAVIAWGVAQLHPEVVDKIVTISCGPVGQLVRNMVPKQAITSYYMLLMTFYPQLFDLLVPAHDYQMVQTILMGEVGMGHITAEDVERYKQALSRPGALQAAVSYYTALWSITAQDPTNPVNRRVLEEPAKQPGLLLYPEREKFIHEDVFEGMEAYAPGATVQKVPGRHFAHYEEPEAVNTAIEAWLASFKPKGKAQP